MEIIGAGGFGKVYLTPKGTVIKAIYTANDCKDAEIEFKKQEKAYQALKSIGPTGIKFLDYMISLLNISKPIKSSNKTIFIDNSKFECSFEMTRLHGIPLSIYEKADPTILNNISKDFGKNFEIMLQLSTNTEIGGRFYGIKYSKTKISEKNPPRGYFLSKNDVVLKYLIENYNFPLTLENIKEMIGFVYGFLYFKARLIPIDIEISLGYVDGNFVVNILDFGMCIDLDNIKYSLEDVKNKRLFTALTENNPDLEEIVKEEISVDLYCDLEDDDYCINGWDIAKKLYS
jgi:hypothetical protein